MTALLAFLDRSTQDIPKIQEVIQKNSQKVSGEILPPTSLHLDKNKLEASIKEIQSVEDYCMK